MNIDAGPSVQAISSTRIAIRMLRVWEQETPVLSDFATGQMKPVLQKWVRYRTDQQDTHNEIEARYLDLVRVSQGFGDRPVDEAARARAQAVIDAVHVHDGVHSTPLPDGHMSLDKWKRLSPVHVEVLRANRIYSVQQLRDATHAKLANLPGAISYQNLKEEARAFLATELDNYSVQETLLLKNQLATQSAQVAELKEMVVLLIGKAEGKFAAAVQGEAETPKRRGRPPRAENGSSDELVDAEASI